MTKPVDNAVTLLILTAVLLAARELFVGEVSTGGVLWRSWLTLLAVVLAGAFLREIRK